MKFAFKLFVLILVAGAFYAAWLFIPKKAQSGAAAGPPGGGGATRVVVHSLEEVPFFTRIDSVGSLLAAESVEIAANVTEGIEQLHFDNGSVVTNGQLLVVLSHAEELARYDGAKAVLAEQLRELERLRGLVAQGATSEVRVEERATAADIARRSVEEANARLADRFISAPFDGIIGLRMVSVGALVGPGTVIANLDKIDTLRLDFAVPETFIGTLKPGLRITARSAAYPDKLFEGELAHIDSRVDTITRSVKVRVFIDNADSLLRPGMLLTTTLESTPSVAPAIPERAIISSGPQHHVYVIVPGPENSAKVSKREVKIGRRMNGFAEAQSGVAAGEVIVTDGLVGMRDGASVVIAGQFSAPSPMFDPTNSAIAP